MAKLFLQLAIVLSVAAGASSYSVAMADLDSDSETFCFISGVDTLLTGAEIESYIRTLGYIILTNEGYLHWTSYVNHVRVDGGHLARETYLTNAPFRLEYLGETILEGTISSGYESKLVAGVQLFDSELEYNRSRLSLRYIRVERDMPESPLETDRFLEYFRESGKLVDWQMDR